MDNNNMEMLSAAQETVKSQLIEGWWISDGLIYNEDFSDYREDIAVEQLSFSVRASNGLRRAELHMLSDLLIITVEELAAVKNMGAKSVDEILSTVSSYLQGELKVDTPLPTKEGDERTKSEMVESMRFEELPLRLLSLSTRSTRALARSGYRYIYELADFSFDDFKQIKNLGVKSAEEIYEAVQRFRKEYEEKESTEESPVSEPANEPTLKLEDITSMIEKLHRESEQCGSTIILKECDHLSARAKKQDPMLIRFIHDSSDIFRIPSVTAAIDKCITEGLIRHEIDGLSFVEIKEMLPESLDSELLQERLTKLTENRAIKCTDRYYMYYPSFADILAESSDDRSAQVIIMRTQGMTLEEIAGELGGLTRERVRQIEAKYLRKLYVRYGHMDEDKYKHLYLTYDLSEELMERYLGFSKATIYFLENKYKGTKKKNPIEDTLYDSEIPASIKKRIEKYILSKKIWIGNDLVEAKVYLIEDALFPILCKETITYSEFVERYNEFVIDNEKADLIITEESMRTRMNKYAASDKILWTLNQRMRYYDTQSIDKDAFLDRLNLDQYHNIEISAKKILDENPDLMAEYDIRNEYELHNLLKKINVESDYPELVLGRNPIMLFGEANREKQVIDLLTQLTPIDQYAFADAYSERYGVAANTAMANYLPYVKQYLNKDRVLEMDVPSLSNEELNRLKEKLTDDYYPIEKLQTIFRREYPSEPLEKINHYTLHQLGFRVYSGYVIRATYRSAQEFFSAILTEGDIIDTNLFPREFIYNQSYYGVLTMYTSSYELIEFLPKKYIKLSRLTELFGTTKEDIVCFCQHAASFTSKPFFTIRSLKQEGFDDELFELGFDDYFYSSVLFADKEHIAHKKVGGNMLFRIGTKPFLYSDFIEWLIYREESMYIDVYELMEKLKNTYGIKLERWDIKDKILPGTSMYYSDITEKLYADYEIYFDEI